MIPGADSDALLRLDQAIAARHPEISRRKARELIAAKMVLVDAHLVGAASRMIASSQAITLFTEVPAVPVLAETAEWIAFDKPAGVPAQPARERDRPSLLEMASVMLAARGKVHTLYPLHRLDSGTSGVIVVARSAKAAGWLSPLFAGPAVEKEYLALVAGEVDEEIVIDAPIGRESADRFAVRPEGRSAVTRFQPVARAAQATLLRASITHGRTHQIRIHAAYAGHSVIGDRKYGGPVAERLMLHAATLRHPRLGELAAPLPDPFKAVAGQWGVAL